MAQAPRVRVARRPVHGVLLLDKPIGLSSNQALQKVKWLLRAEKAGHTGTLDPLATGVLPLCFGAATKFSQAHLDADKAYETIVRLGQKTTTADAEGAVLLERPVHVDADLIEHVLARFRGDIAQVPPMYSALKKDGKALYEYARAGEEVERASRNVRIHQLKWAAEPMDIAEPAIKLIVDCSKGTYIRTLGEDIGEALGCGGHLKMLRRTRTGAFGLERCITLEQLESMSEEQRLQQLLPVDVLLPGYTEVTLDASNAGRFLSGMRRRGQWPDAEQVAVFAKASAEHPRALLGSAHIKAGELIPQRLLTPLEIEQTLAQASPVFLKEQEPTP
ncbi:tRNA pseudouridine(55) synthase TruB [Curvibacter sp. CHRR-16]|uniref:tRNA pseudouridine(55) synthase TruB n=1 Tax=Curvibacter sp. CHRR-16 TaxID=2835872 RepID=UPI001BD9B1C2|nr:tRNA pseudouridine(55) synthase TruB [Curvibacter sp. CHRR-16]MBT0571214.1 tRNA pseudouridine(55) synthase TruB [Curvibacter sp. CHRR-16]